MDDIRISAKDLVTFLYAAGDLATQTKLKHAANTGQRMHNLRQSQYSDTDQKEVFVETKEVFNDIRFHITGRIDGVLHRENEIIIEEIKSTETDLTLLKEDTYPAHMMQAKMYSYLYMKKHDLKSISVHLTYVHIQTEKMHTIKKRYNYTQISKAFNQTVNDYLEWLKIYQEHQFNKQKSLEGLVFPHDKYREGQYQFMGAVYQTILKQDILYATAPTGIGKTIAALFSGLKTLSHDKEKLFFLTAKNVGKSIAVKTIEDLKAKGLKIKAITLNSKENMCLQEEVDCDPELCPYAKGFYNRLKGALEDIFVHDDVYDATLIKQYAQYHTICPHEFALEISNYSDIIICDYNYVFDPRIKLIRYFEDDYYQPKLLIDEAHNLIDRSRSMYSASLTLSDIEALYTLIKDLKPSPQKAIGMLKTTMESLVKTHDVKKAKLFVSESLNPTLLQQVHYLTMKLDELLQIHKKHPKRKAIREGYFLLTQFMRISEYFSEAFRFTVEALDEDFSFNIVCFDASKPLTEIIDARSHGTILFSATLQPVDYYANLITGGKGKKFSIPSPFEANRLGLYFDVSTSTKYHDRTLSIPRIIDTIYAMVESRKGNYIVFFPSYVYMHKVLEQLASTGAQVMVQERGMSMHQREALLQDFKETTTESKLLFSVLGGSFSEGIDYIGDFLNGVLVVGVALPMFNAMNQLLKDYFFEKGYNGFDYAYTYPGMNKVIQAVGRVIRTESDKGIAILLDSRYQQPKYLDLFPLHWSHYNLLQESDYVQGYLTQFWSKFEEEDEDND